MNSVSQGEAVIVATHRVAGSSLPAAPGLADAEAGVAPRLAEGTELIGEYRGSGLREPKYLVRRGDGQVLQLPRLLYLVAARLDGRRSLAEVAAAVSAEVGRELAAEQAMFLVRRKLQPAGLISAPALVPAMALAARSGRPPRPPLRAGCLPDRANPLPTRSDPLLALRFRLALIPARVAWLIGAVFRPLFWPPVVLSMVGAFAALDALIIAHGGLARLAPSAAALVSRPALTLLVLGLVLVAAAFHECGHVTACRYGGARPGVMGLGLFLVWPAFYSTVTDAYRLGRGGRLRTDLGGVYFNSIFIAGMSAAYIMTGYPWLLVFMILWHIETAWQFLPSLRLDGYYILADLVGVPDLFNRMGPVLRSLMPGRQAHARVLELKVWVRRLVSLWVAVVLCCMLVAVAGFLIMAPRLLPAAWHSLFTLTRVVAVSARDGSVARAALGTIQIFLVLLPWAGIGLLAVSMTGRLAPQRGRHRRSRSSA
jgi:putative peptide zinc metalloprotease protein